MSRLWVARFWVRVCLLLSLAASSFAQPDLLISGRLETIYLHGFTEPIRQASSANHRFYFNNIFLNLEGDPAPGVRFIVEFQPLTSDLYLLGGFLTIADALEGLGADEPSERKTRIAGVIQEEIRELDEASRRVSFERAAVTFMIGESAGLSLGRVRNPFGFWDDYSIFRNLSALKTDPVTLGVPLRRVDQGVVFFGRRGASSLRVGLLEGTKTLHAQGHDDDFDAVARLNHRIGPVDLGVSGYAHDVGSSHWNRAYSLSYRWRATYDLTLIGEVIEMENDALDLETGGFYVQGTYDLSDAIAEGLRWNLFFEKYDSDLLDIDLEPDLDYRFAGTYFQASTGFVYAYRRNIELGAKLLSGLDEEGDSFYKLALKIDTRF